jgi:hypothetical protein
MACILLWSVRAHAWILPEHAQITEEATQELGVKERAVLQSLWNEARRASPEHLCEGLGRAPADAEGRVACLGFADLPSVAGDHSCSPRELLFEVSRETWLRDVVEVGNVTERRIRDARSSSTRINAWSRSNLLLEQADVQYAARATSNEGHFVPTAWPGQSLDDYLGNAVKADVPLNAAALYVVFHLSALRFAAAYVIDGTRRQQWARLALFSEVFALHFLEDSFSSGHTVGTWGGPAMMKGTHDAYSIKGLPGRTWSGESYSPHGDAHMTPADLRRTRQAVATSLAEVTRVVTDPRMRAAASASWLPEHASYLWSFDTCKSTELGFTVPARTASRFASSAWRRTVRPMPGEDHAHMPRFRAEIGPYFSFGAGADGSAIWGGYFSDDASTRASANVLVFAGLGIGLEGAIGIASDGLIELGVGTKFASSQYEPGCTDCGAEDSDSGSIPTRVPTRSAILFHYRAPFWLIPGDLLLVAPILLAVDFDLYKGMAIIAANGGAFGLQPIILTSIGTFQFMLGRELYVSLFNGDDGVFAFNGGDPEAASSYSLFEVNSVEIDAPVLTYQPFRSFSNTLTSAVGLQLGGAIDLPSATDARTGEDVSPGVAYSVYLRLVLDSRWYLGSSAP